MTRVPLDLLLLGLLLCVTPYEYFALVAFVALITVIAVALYLNRIRKEKEE